MFLELIATAIAGIATAGMVMLLNRVTGGRLPRWVAPVAAGLAMIGMTISMEYSWYSRTLSNLPEGVVVAQPVEKSPSFYQPWTYVAPYVDRFVAADELSVRRNADLPEQRLVDLYFFGRWAPLSKVPVLMDCDMPRMAALVDDVKYASTGEVIAPDWVPMETDDPIRTLVCGVPS